MAGEGGCAPTAACLALSEPSNSNPLVSAFAQATVLELGGRVGLQVCCACTVLLALNICFITPPLLLQSHRRLPTVWPQQHLPRVL